ncbi:hypothetical protein [uncultured Sulfitobacter sp.]|uniref:hypothetical protein n=1 Tax=uncultured Sulfitobacter sp. TaxID=191468 RepID=UPI00260C8B94|nr:hypothetical protein [uncultured Sulfitobacter sp.]
MRALFAAILVVAVAACGPPEAPRNDTVSPRQQPSTTTPGVTVSGSVEFGVKRGL